MTETILANAPPGGNGRLTLLQLAERIGYVKLRSDSGAPEVHDTLKRFHAVVREHRVEPVAVEELRQRIKQVLVEIGYEPANAWHLLTAASETPTSTGTIVRCAASVTICAVAWLWAGYIPSGKLTLLVGDPSAGKTTIALDLGARLAAGLPMPDGQPGHGPADVLFLSAEDDAGDTLVPRLASALAARWPDAGQRVRFIAAMMGATPITIPDHVDVLGELVERHGARLLVLDPLDALLGGTDSHRNVDVRVALAPVADMAARTGCAVLGIQHLRKAATSSPIHRPSGSVAFTAAARSVLLAGDIPDDDAGRRALVALKSNLSRLPASLGYSIAAAGPDEPAFIDWSGIVQLRADEMLVAPTDATERQHREHLADVLHDLLASGPRSLADLTAGVRAAGLADVPGRTLRWTLAHKVGARSAKVGMSGGWTWELAPDLARGA